MSNTETASLVEVIRQNQKDKTSDLIQFYDRKNFYSVYGSDALFIANEYFKTLATIYYIGADKLPCQTIQPGQLEAILLDLINDKQYKFEIWASKVVNKWERIKKCSPGNISGIEGFFSSFIELETVDSVTIAVNISQDQGNKIVGVALCDVTQRLFRVSQFLDSIHFTNLESVIVQAAGVKECLFNYDDKSSDCKVIAEILKRCNVVLTPVKARDFTSQDIEQDLTRLLGKLTNNLSEMELKSSMGSLSCLIKYLELLSDESNFGLYKLKRLDLSQYMKLDAAAIEALKLIPSKKDVNKLLNLYGLLNKCNTSMGSRRLMSWIKQPLLSLEDITLRQNLVEVFYHDLVLRQNLRENLLKTAPDFSRIVKKLQKNQASLEDCLKLYYFLRNLPKVRDAFAEYQGVHDQVVHERYTSTLNSLVEDFVKFNEMIETTVDLEAANNHEYLIRFDFDDDLSQLYTDKTDVYNQIVSHANDIGKKLQVKSFGLASSPLFGHYFRVSRRDEKILREKKDLKYVEIDTKKDGVKFKTTLLKKLSDQYEDYKESYMTKQKELVDSLLKIVAEYQDPILEVSELVTEVDVVASLAFVFSNSPQSYVRPILSKMGEGDIVLKGARHPCLELQDSLKYIPNDCSLIRSKSSFQIITGPNMGGKSTYIRSVGIIVLMAQMGCFVPCTSAQISIVDSILCRVGAGDNQSRGVSTFMAEMLETTQILETATPHSLIIIDELGRGTSTYDGYGLAYAISEHICTKIGAFCFFATHFHELTVLEKKLPNVANYHVSAKPSHNELTLLYKVKPGACDQSFGIHVAEMANFPEVVIKLAKRKAEELENFDQNQAKKSKTKDEIEAEEIIEKFIEEFCEIPFDKLNDDDAITKLDNLRAQIDSQNNPLIKSILSGE